MARKKVKNGRTVQLNIRCTPEDKVNWRAAARRAKMKMSHWFRERAQAPVSVADVEALPLAPDEVLPEFASILTRLHNFTCRLATQGVDVSTLRLQINNRRQQEEKRLARLELIRAKGNALVHASNLGADQAALQDLTGQLIRLLSSYEQ